MVASLRTVISDSRSSAIPLAAARPSAAGVLALGRIEARKMVRHPAFWGGFAVCLLLFRGAIGAEAETTMEVNIAWLVGGLLIGLLVGTILSANIAALRPRRDHVLDLYGSMPSSPETRTAGLFAGLILGPVLISLIPTALGWWAFKRVPGVDPGDIDGFLAVQVPLTVIALGTVAIAVGRWVPSLFGGPVIIAAHLFTGLIWLVPWIVPRSSEVDATWHLVYIAAAITTWVAFALARDRRALWRFAIAGATLVLGIFAAFQQAPPGGY